MKSVRNDGQIEHKNWTTKRTFSSLETFLHALFGAAIENKNQIKWRTTNKWHLQHFFSF